MFKNIGQAAARNETISEIILVKLLTNILSEKEEEDYFSQLKNNVSPSAIHNDIQPGSDGYFYNAIGLTDQAWEDFKKTDGPPKFLYVMSILTYHSENLEDRDPITTETCVIYMNKDSFSNWSSCRSDHNKIHKLN
jgi:hypothetical protein